MDKIRAQKKHFAAGLITFGIGLIGVSLFMLMQYFKPTPKVWEFQSIDTMKYSRDLAREKLKDASFDTIIENQVKAIADTGATHIGIATPYDEEFLPILKRWVKSSRENKLKVWYRGNFSGWEGWFGYSRITREEHLELTESFIINNPDLFENGDVFSSCPECENGGPGDPRNTGDITGHQKFLITEYELSLREFEKINKKVVSNYSSMNLDVAKKIMDKDTTKKLGGIVTIDHYVKGPEELNNDINNIAEFSGGKVVIGEFGAPIPDINGKMSEVEQSEWIERVMRLLVINKNVIGVNYWVNTGGTTQIWNDKGEVREGALVLKKYYKKTY